MNELQIVKKLFFLKKIFFSLSHFFLSTIDNELRNYWRCLQSENSEVHRVNDREAERP
jgi:hypothetical protein